MIYKFTIPYLLEEYFENDEEIKPLSSNISDWSIDPDALEIIVSPTLEQLKTLNTTEVDYLSTLIDGYYYLKYDEIIITTQIPDIFEVNDIVWCENEPMIVTHKMSSTRYFFDRPYPREHVYSGILSKTYPINIQGCFGYITDEKDKVVKWVYIDGLMTTGAGAVLSTSDILKMYDSTFPIRAQRGLNGKSPSEAALETGLRSFLEGTRYVQDSFIVEDWESSGFFKGVNPFELLMKNAKLRGVIVRFDVDLGKYTLIKISQPSGFNTSITGLTLDDKLTYKGGYSFTALAGGTKVKVKGSLTTIENGAWVKGDDLEFSYNHGSTFNSYQDELEIDVTGIVAKMGMNIINNNKANTIFFLKQLINNGVASIRATSYGQLTITKIPSFTPTVGTYYKLDDRYNFNLFLPSTTDIYLLCTSTTNTESKFLVLMKTVYAPIAPVILVRYVGAITGVGSYCIQLISPNGDLNVTLDDYFENTKGDCIQSVAMEDDTLLYVTGNSIQLVDIANGSIYTRNIVNVLDNYMALSSATSLVMEKDYYLRLRYFSPNATTSRFLFYNITGGGGNV